MLSLEHAPQTGARLRHVLGSRDDSDLMRQLAEQGSFDGIVDLIAYHAADVDAAIETWKHAPHRLNRYVLLSTLAAVGSFRSALASEETAVSVSDPDQDYASGKAACERTLQSAAWQGFPGVILRAAPIFGPGDAVSRENYVVQRLLLGLPIPCLSARNATLVRVFARDLVQSIVSCFARPVPAGRAYHLVQRENVTFEHYVQSIAKLIGCEARLEVLEWEQAERAGLNPAALPLGGADPTIRFSIDRAVTELGFRPTPFPVALRETIDGILSKGAFQHPAWPGGSSTQARLAGTQQHLQLEAERELWDGKHRRTLQHDEIIRALVEPSDCALVRCEDWSALATLEPGEQDAIMLPESLRSWLTQTPMRSPWHRRPVLQAAIEPARSASGAEFHVYSRAQLRKASGYGFGNAPLTLRLCGFMDLHEAVPVSAQQRVVVAVRDRSDVDALLEWLAQCEREQAVTLSDVNSLARIYLVDSIGWVSLSGGSGWQAELRASVAIRNPHIGQWCGVFEACRRLQKRAGTAAGRVRLEREVIVSS